MLGPYVVRQIERPSRDATNGLRECGVATVHEAYNQRGLMRPEIRPVATGQKIGGPAVTVLCHSGDNTMLHVALEVVQPGDVIVVATLSPCTDGMVGELIATQCQVRGVAGMILDAGVRDTADLRSMGFPVWSRAVSAAGTGKAHPGWVNTPVTCGGMLVHPGDVVVGDDDGVVIVAREDASWVLQKSRERMDSENTSRERYRNGELSLDVGNMRGLVAKLGIQYLETAPEE